MKKHLIIIAAAITAVLGSANAYEINHISECIGGTCPSDGHVRDGVVYGNCTSSLCDCVTATVSYALTCHCEYDNDCASGYGCNTSSICTKCKSCSNCTSDTSYSYLHAGYERRTLKSCGCHTGTCTTNYAYRCTVGYYGTSTNGTTGCTRCPASDGTYGTTTTAGTQDITQCYLPASTPMTDTSGTFLCSGNSNYK